VTAKLLSPGAIELIMQMAGRRKGVNTPQISEHFNISHLAAWRALQRLVQAGRLYVVGSRRRELLFAAGRGAIIYKARTRYNREELEGHHGEGDEGTDGDEAGGDGEGGAPAG
jgi:predicted transcriptional regulator